MNKKIYVIAFFIIGIIIFFILFAYKNLSFGNNINKSDNNNILNISSYDAIIEVEVYSNKNKNKYVLEQKYSKPNNFRQEVIEPENIKGLLTIYDGTNLIIENKALNLKTIYRDYNCINENSLSLISFIEQYKKDENAEIKETSDEIIIKIKIDENNKYEMYKKLYIDKNTNMPKKIEILDFNQNITAYILYREININKD